MPSPPHTIISLPVQTAACESRATGALMVLVAVQLSVLGLYRPPVFKTPLVSVSAPDNHLTADPNCRVKESRNGRISGAGGCPAISAGIVSPASVQSAASRFRPRRSSHCRSKLPRVSLAHGRISRAGGCPSVSAGIVPPACVQRAAVGSAPDDHLTAGPNGRVEFSRKGRINGAGRCPAIRAGIIARQCSNSWCYQEFRPRRSSHCRSKRPCEILAHWAH